MGQTPIIPGDLYLRVSARVKVLSGNLPDLRIAAWAGDAADQNVAGGPDRARNQRHRLWRCRHRNPPSSARRRAPGVDMPWGPRPATGISGLDLTGPEPGRCASRTSGRGRHLGLPSQDDGLGRCARFRAVGDGTTDDRDAFVAADAAAAGREVLVPAGTYLIGSQPHDEQRRCASRASWSMPGWRAPVAELQNFDLKRLCRGLRRRCQRA
jgi:hypothetical protein